MEMLHRFSASYYPPGAVAVGVWAWVTITLSSLVAAGYGVIAFNWYFQSKLAPRSESNAALARLGAIVLGCAGCGAALMVSDAVWAAWRLYDAALLVLACYAWWFVMRMRGLGLVDERLARVAELEESAGRYREIAELLPHMVWTATAEGRVDFSNRRWGEYAGDGRTWLDAVHPEEGEQVMRWWRNALQVRQPVTREIRLGGAAGYRTFVVTATPIVHGDAVKWLGACADVEDQKQLAAQREAAAKQKTFFLNAISHDLRAPLNNVVLNAHVLKMSARGQVEVEAAELAEAAEMMIENAVAAADLVSKLLDFAKLGAEEGNSAERVSVPGVLRQVARRFGPLAEKKGLYLRVADSADGVGVEVVTDRQKLERVIGNLVDNGIKYTSRGGVTLETLATEDGVAVRVADTGIGVPRDNVERLFDEFYQVNNHERDRSKGFGMGLAICRCLARQLGGDVRLAGTGAGGSCFEVFIGGVGAGGRRRSGGEEGDGADPEEARLCGV